MMENDAARRGQALYLGAHDGARDAAVQAAVQRDREETLEWLRELIGKLRDRSLSSAEDSCSPGMANDYVLWYGRFMALMESHWAARPAPEDPKGGS